MVGDDEKRLIRLASAVILIFLNVSLASFSKL